MEADAPMQALVGLDGQEVLVQARDAPIDLVRLPDELGGYTVRVQGQGVAECPGCESKHMVRVLVLPEGRFVAECKEKGFLWCTTSG